MLLLLAICAANFALTKPPAVDPPGSARYVLATSVDRRIAGKDPAKALALLADYPASGSRGEFRRNPDFWGRDIDFSCLSVWNSADGNCRAGTAISPWHVIFAAHFPMGKGTRLVFLDRDGVSLTRTIVSTRRVGKTDLMVGALDAALPPSVAPARLLPEGYQRYIHQAGGMPVVTFNQRKEATVGNMIGMADMPDRHRAFAILPTQKPDRMAFNREIIVGDSGSPAFLILDRTPILVYILQAGKAGSGDSPHMVRAALESVMESLHPDVRPTYVDFSSYPTILQYAEGEVK